MAKELLKVEGLCQYFGKHKAVEDVSFAVYEGEVFGLVGESGSGKTTTGRSIIGLYDIFGGEKELRRKRRNISFNRNILTAQKHRITRKYIKFA